MSKKNKSTNCGCKNTTHPPYSSAATDVQTTSAATDCGNGNCGKNGKKPKKTY
jgi:hypothetical protein